MDLMEALAVYWSEKRHYRTAWNGRVALTFLLETFPWAQMGGNKQIMIEQTDLEIEQEDIKTHRQRRRI